MLVNLSEQFQSEKIQKFFNAKHNHFCMVQLFKLSYCKNILSDFIILQFCLLKRISLQRVSKSYVFLP